MSMQPARSVIGGVQASPCRRAESFCQATTIVDRPTKSGKSCKPCSGVCSCAVFWRRVWSGPLRADDTAAQRRVLAARSQVGVTTFYDPAYVLLEFPGGNIDRSRGVCTDAVIRAFRDAPGIDLQSALNRDMKAAFSSDPKAWGLKRPDRKIDHRRVGNLQHLFERVGAMANGGAVMPGDIVTVMLPNTR